MTAHLWGRRDTPYPSDTFLPTSLLQERTALAFGSYCSLNTVEKLHPFMWSNFPSWLASSTLTHLFQCSASHFSTSCLQSWARYPQVLTVQSKLYALGCRSSQQPEVLHPWPLPSARHDAKPRGNPVTARNTSQSTKASNSAKHLIHLNHI